MALKVIISIIALVIVTLHVIFPKITFDYITIILMVIAILPWLTQIIKSLELPGGIKVEFKELEKAREQAEKIGLFKDMKVKNKVEYSFQLITNDPNLALAGLRIEIEKRFKKLAEKNKIDAKEASVFNLMQILKKNNILKNEEYVILSDMITLLNSAVHGAKVDERAAYWAFDIGPKIIKSLEDKIKKN